VQRLNQNLDSILEVAFAIRARRPFFNSFSFPSPPSPV
jgi:hypothetical protein